MTRTSLEATTAFYSASPMISLFRWGLGASQCLGHSRILKDAEVLRELAAFVAL